MSPFRSIIDQHPLSYAPYEDFYRKLHANPELSWREFETAKAVAQKLREMSSDLDIKEGIAGTGIIAVFRNGPGKAVMLRADMDALPLKEQTRLPYASYKEMKDVHGDTQPVMHACGHDMHVTALLAAAGILLSSREHWSGTIVFLFQPAEESTSGARGMVTDGLYEKYGCPIPDVVLGQHVSFQRTGRVFTRPGLLMAGVVQMMIKIFGKGGHGSMPHMAVDPVVMAAHIVVRLQTIVSREVQPGEVGVVTVGAIHAGTANNVIPAHAELRLSVRFTTAEQRNVIVDGIQRVVHAECLAARSPQDPIFHISESTNPMINDIPTTEAVSNSFKAHFGAGHMPLTRVVPAAEDFSELATAIGKPYCFWFLGGHDGEDYDRREKEGTLNSLPSLHSPFFAPAVQPTLTTGAEALVTAALTFLSAEKS
ncbi:Hippurate hydrolase [Talaromyces pinophilus]|nr:Hippurate hydrolase [Talaromyces pinophilus]